MKLDAQPPTTAINAPTFDFLDPVEIIDAMIELRIQLVQSSTSGKAGGFDLAPKKWTVKLSCCRLSQE